MTEVGNVYGQSLYELAKDEGLSREIGEQLTVLQKSFGEEPDFVRLLSNPSLSKPERCRILDTSFRGSVHPYILNFMKILTERGYIRHFSDCCDAFSELYNRDNGILKVTAVTAVALTPAQEEKLTGKLSQITGKTIAPMAVSANPERFTDEAKIEKWFRRNCKEVVGRECTAAEKADFLAWLVRQ